MATDLFKTLDTISAFHYYNSWIYRNIQPHLSGVVLDVGSGIGDIAKYYKDHKAISKVVLTDGFEEMLTVLNDKFKKDDFYSVFSMDITDTSKIPAHLKSSADSITCINVLEHIEDHGQALKNMASLLKPGGRLVLMVPALPAIYGTLDDLVGHYRRYTRTMLSPVLVEAGLKVERQYYMNMFGIFSWFMAGRVLRYKQFKAEPCKALDRLVPVFESLEKYAKPFIGQSLITVCRKENTPSDE